MRYALITVLIVAAFLRLYHLESFPPGLYPDEAMNGNNALEAIETGNFKVFYPENNGREGLFINIQALALWITNTHEPWVLRSVSALMGILTILALYWCGATLFNRYVGLFSAVLGATSYWHLTFSRIGFRAIMAPLVFTIAVTLIWKLSERIRLQYSLDWWRIVLAGAVYGLGFHTYIAYRLTPLLILPILFLFFIYAIRHHAVRSFLRILVLYGVGVAIIIAPLVLYFVGHPAELSTRTNELTVWQAPHPVTTTLHNTAQTLGMLIWEGDHNWRHDIPGQPVLLLLPALLFALGTILLAVRGIQKKQLSRLSLLLGWVVVGLLPGILANEGVPHALRTLLAFPPLMILAGYGLYVAYSFITDRISKHTAHVFTVVISIVLAAQAAYLYFVIWAPSTHTFNAFNGGDVALARHINALPSNHDPVYIVLPHEDVTARGIPIRAQTIMFLTNTFLLEGQHQKHIFYVTDTAQIPETALVFSLN